MARDKLDPGVEREHHYHAFEVWRDLGYGRSFRKTAELVGSSPGSVCMWAKLYKWEERLNEYAASVQKKTEDGALVKIDDPTIQKMTTMLDQIEAVIDSCFSRDVTGKPSLKRGKMEVKTITELALVVKEYRQLLEVYHKFVSEHKPKAGDRKRNTAIEEFNVIFNNVSQEERIGMMGRMVDGNEPGRNKRAKGSIQDADYHEVSGSGDEDGYGREGVPGSTPDSGGGD